MFGGKLTPDQEAILRLLQARPDAAFTPARVGAALAERVPPSKGRSSWASPKLASLHDKGLIQEVAKSTYKISGAGRIYLIAEEETNA